jgi:hypothetical protein
VDAPRTAQDADVHLSIGARRVVVNAPNVSDEQLTDALAVRLARVAEIFAGRTS